MSLTVSSGGRYWEHSFPCMSIQQCSFTQRCWLVKGQANIVELALPSTPQSPSARSRLAEWQEVTWPSGLDNVAC